MTVLNFLVAAFAVYRLSHLIRLEAAPFQLARRFRTLVGLHRKDGVEWVQNKSPILRQIPEALQCPYCTSVWLALPVVPLMEPPSLLAAGFLWFGISGAAMLFTFGIEALELLTVYLKSGDEE